MNGCFACMYMHHFVTWVTVEARRGQLNSPGLEFETVAGAGN